MSSSSESIDTTVFGPLTDNQTTLPEVPPTQDDIGLRVFRFSPRNAESYLVRISDPTSRNALYTLNGELSSSGICEEDVFDAELPGDSTLGYGVEDAPGLNDANPTIFSFSQERRRFRRISVSTTVMPSQFALKPPMHSCRVVKIFR